MVGFRSCVVRGGVGVDELLMTSLLSIYKFVIFYSVKWLNTPERSLNSEPELSSIRNTSENSSCCPDWPAPWGLEDACEWEAAAAAAAAC